MICVCNRIDASAIVKVLKKWPQATNDEIAHLTGASLSCGRCKGRLERFISSNRSVAKQLQLKLFKDKDFG